MLCRVIVPSEYGITTDQKISVGLKIIDPLLRKIHHDLLWWMTPQITKDHNYEMEKQDW